MTLELSAVNKSFGQNSVLNEVTLSLRDLSALVLIGPSGGGKSTLLRILAGLEVPDSGTVSINGATLPTSAEALRRYRGGIGTVFQAFNLFPHLSALANIVLPLEKVHGLSPAEAEQRALETLRRFQLESHAWKKPAQLSGGQKQRVAIARAVAIKPRLLLFDEPTSALDPEMTAEVLEMIEDLKRESRDLVVVTHSMAFAKKVADQVAFLHGGRVLEYGPPASFLAHPTTPECQTFLNRVLKY